MIEMTALQESQTLCFCLRGVQSAAEFGALSSVLPSTSSQRRWRILFDWTELLGWDDRRALNLSCQFWHSAADRIVRVSIVHQHRWNHQAALLAAVLRVRDVQVRSWSPRYRVQALTWLSQQ